MKQIVEDKLVRKSKEQDRLHAAVQSVRDELEDEMKLRKRSESVHRKLARELSEDWAQGVDNDHLILHISESWLNEHMERQLDAIGVVA
ncbi:hypothetical protein RIF29_41957 [Crotalaria pallida]|uniref:Uncharacterized protein n=1 Tax=Crotalaria pallida TaxID=3830 RepID=A0AAN9HPV9_CROPI